VPTRPTPLVDRLKAPLRQPFRRYRLATRKARILPAFLVIGAQRAGTTTFFDALRRHPDIGAPRSVDRAVAWDKELHFFDEKFEKGLDWYRSFFPLRALREVRRALGRDLIAGESTPSYLFYPRVPQRVAGTIPEARLIAVLRDPVERAYSHYQLMRRTGQETLSFAEAVAAEEERLAGEREQFLAGDAGRLRHHRHHSYVARGLYAEQLERWLEHFPREQLLVLRAEDFKTRPVEIYSVALRFLGVREWQPGELVSRNIGSYAPLDRGLRAQLEDRFADSNARLAQLLGKDLGWAPSAATASAARRADA
jgi:hypothetical protein